MPLFVFQRRRVALGLLVAVLGSPLGSVQAATPDIPAVISVCAPVISEQYDGETERWGACVNAVKTFLDAVGAASSATDPTVADLVVALTELYQDDESCKLHETELPEAIEVAANRVTNKEQTAQILEISATIKDCQQFATAAIVAQASAF